MASSHPIPAPCQWFSRLASALDRRSAPRLALLFLGALLARGRRTVTSWVRAAGLSDRYQSCYLAVAAAWKKTGTIAAPDERRIGPAPAGPLLQPVGDQGRFARPDRPPHYKGRAEACLVLVEPPKRRPPPHVEPRMLAQERPMHRLVAPRVHGGGLELRLDRSPEVS